MKSVILVCAIMILAVTPASSQQFKGGTTKKEGNCKQKCTTLNASKSNSYRNSKEGKEELRKCQAKCA